MRPIILLVMLCVAVKAQATDCVFESGPDRTHLLELFTSEGCSSCPSAEAWLSKLKAEPRLWKDFVPIAFHVDYWDRLGWRDPLPRKNGPRGSINIPRFGRATVFTLPVSCSMAANGRA